MHVENTNIKPEVDGKVTLEADSYIMGFSSQCVWHEMINRVLGIDLTLEESSAQCPYGPYWGIWTQNNNNNNTVIYIWPFLIIGSLL